MSGSLISATGYYKLVLTDEIYRTEYNFSIVISGDVSGDGNIDALDLVKIKSHLLKNLSLSGVYKKAADVDTNGKVSISDLLSVKKHILKIS